MGHLYASTSGNASGTSASASASPDRKRSKPRQAHDRNERARVGVLGRRARRARRRAEHPHRHSGRAEHVALARYHSANSHTRGRAGDGEKGGVGVTVAAVDIEVGRDLLEDLAQAALIVPRP
jgi:hypothetical protein